MREYTGVGIPLLVLNIGAVIDSVLDDDRLDAVTGGGIEEGGTKQYTCGDPRPAAHALDQIVYDGPRPLSAQKMPPRETQQRR